MGLLDSNFLAKSDFCVKTQGGGVITTQLNFKIDLDDESPEPGIRVSGLMDIDFSASEFMQYMGQHFSPYDVIPSYDKNKWVYGIDANENQQEFLKRFRRLSNFWDFVQKNPIHVNKINIRATDPTMLPTQILVETPNIFEGDAGRQIIDVSSQKTAYQYQNNIVTIENTDLFIGRNSNIKFNAAFSMSEEEFYERPIYIDWFVDYYLSLEKALYQNVKNL